MYSVRAVSHDKSTTYPSKISGWEAIEDQRGTLVISFVDHSYEAF